jgi:hypothetical protein
MIPHSMAQRPQHRKAQEVITGIAKQHQSPAQAEHTS